MFPSYRIGRSLVLFMSRQRISRVVRWRFVPRGVIGCRNGAGHLAAYHPLIALSLVVMLAGVARGGGPQIEGDSGTKPNPSEAGAVTIAPTSAALRSIFSSAAAPPRKTMGLLQRSFVELSGQTRDDLEIALVIDGTDSMADSIEGVRQSVAAMLEDLRRGRKGEVRMAIVVYRDSGSPSGAVRTPIDRFTADPEAIASGLASISVESGAPFFHELPDAGLHHALASLPWTEGDDVTRWAFLVGDAPPYAENYASPEFPQARRAYATDLLVGLATRKGIQVHTLLCDSTPTLQSSYNEALPETRAFMHALASGTGGLMLDLSYPDIRKAIVEAGQRPRPDYVEIEPISGDDLKSVRDERLAASAAAEPSAQKVKIAVLPHAPLQQMTFDPRHPAVQVATGLRHKLSILPRVTLSSPYDIERQLRRLRAAGISDSQQVRSLGNQLGADYVIWGKQDPLRAQVVSAVYSSDDDRPIVEVSHQGEATQLASLILASNTTDTRFAQLETPPTGMPSLQAKVAQPIARQASTTQELLVALESLQQALGLLAGDPKSEPLLQNAKRAAEAALQAEPTNPMAHWLLANVRFNLASAAQLRNDPAAATEGMKEMKRSLSRANRYRQELDSPSLAEEIRCDHLLLVDRNIPEAIGGYEALANDPQASPGVVRRAHWMLIGIYAGDWSVGKEHVDAKKARDHAIRILANWETSPESTLLKQWLGWDESTDRTLRPFLPRNLGELAQVDPGPLPAS